MTADDTCPTCQGRSRETVNMVCQTCGRNYAPETSPTLHVVPVDDLVDHETIGDDCPCGPVSEAVKHQDGSVGWVITHHSLDGREHSEGDR